MPAQISMESVARGAIKGVVKAQRAYEKSSGGEWLWCAPEYFTTVFVAQEISNLEGAKYVTLEHGATSALEDAGAMGRGKLHHHIRANGRFDILLWWANETPRAPIEVKCQVVSIEKIKEDLLRLEKVIHRKQPESSFQHGMMVFYTSCKVASELSAESVLSERLKQIKSDCKALLPTCDVSMSKSKIYTDDDSAWAAAAIILKPNN